MLSYYVPLAIQKHILFSYPKHRVFPLSPSFDNSSECYRSLLGQIPIVQSIRENGDAGEPAALSSRPDGLAFLNLAEKLVKSVEMP